MLTYFCNIWHTVYGVNLEHNRYSLTNPIYLLLIHYNAHTIFTRCVRTITRHHRIYVLQEAQLSLRDRATRACQLKSCKLLRCTNVDDLHLNSPETDE